MAFCGLDNEAVFVIAAALTQHRSIKKVALGHNPFGPSATMVRSPHFVVLAVKLCLGHCLCWLWLLLPSLTPAVAYARAFVDAWRRCGAHAVSRDYGPGCMSDWATRRTKHFAWHRSSCRPPASRPMPSVHQVLQPDCTAASVCQVLGGVRGTHVVVEPRLVLLTERGALPAVRCR